MDRRNFLAFLPGVATLPMVGTELKKTKSGIMLLDAKPIEIPDLNKININPSRYTLQLVNPSTQVVIGEGFATQVEINWDTIRIGEMELAPGARKITVQGVLNYFNPLYYECSEIRPTELRHGTPKGNGR